MLGSLLLQSDLWAEVSAIVRAEDFYSTLNRQSWKIFEGMHAAGTPIDPMTFRQAVGSPQASVYVADLLDAVLSPSAAPYHARRIRDAARLRKLALAGRDIADAAVEEGATLPDVLEKAERAVFAAAQGVSSGQTWNEALTATIDRIEHHHQTGSTMDGLPTGLEGIDGILGGLQPGWLVYVGARPGVGKTALSVQVATNVAQAGGSVMLCSLEMSVEELARRAICRLAGVSYSKVRHNQMTEKDWEAFLRAKSTLDELPIHAFDNDVDTVSAVASRARALQPELLVIDYVQLMRQDKAKNRNEEIGLISRGLKLLARETGVPVLAPVQLNRNPEARENKRPGISDLRESGSLEQDADAVILLSRTGDEHGAGTTVYLDVAKFRHGPSGSAMLGWDPGTTKFYDL